MPAIISDQFRILNAANFIAGIAGTDNYYTFIGFPNSTDIGAGYGKTDWNENTPAPMDGFREYNDVWDTMLGLKKLSSGDIQRIANVRKVGNDVGQPIVVVFHVEPTHP